MSANVSLDDVKSFHAELVAVAATGLPIELGLGESCDTLAATLENVTSRFSTAITGGKSLEEAVAGELQLSEAYRAALFAWLFGNHSPVALESVTAPVAARKQVQRLFQLSLAQPIVLLTLAFLAFVYLCSTTIPRFESLNVQLSKDPGSALAILMIVRDWMPLWIPLLPILLIVAVTLLRRRKSAVLFRWLPGSGDYVDKIGQAAYAERIADLLENEISLERSMLLAGPIHGPAFNAAEVRVESSSAHDSLAKRLISESPVAAQLSESTRADDVKPKQLPPMLRWALSDNTTGESTATALQFVARSYRRMANMQTQRLRSWLPPLTTAVLGGALVLGIALTVFLPLVELMLFIAGTGGS